MGTAGKLRLDGLDQFQAGHLRHLQIGQHEIGKFAAHRLEPLPAIHGIDDGQAACPIRGRNSLGVFLQQSSHQTAVHGGIIDHQNFGHGAFL